MGQNQFNDITEDLLQWKKDIPFPASLQNEFRRWQLLWCTKNDVPDTFLHTLACCNVDSFPNIYQLLVIACTLPVTSAEAERSFSLLRRLKKYMRSTMSEECMGDLGVIAMHYGERIPCDEICKEFVQQNPRRLFKPSLFVD